VSAGAGVAWQDRLHAIADRPAVAIQIAAGKASITSSTFCHSASILIEASGSTGLTILGAGLRGLDLLGIALDDRRKAASDPLMSTVVIAGRAEAYGTAKRP
jgi:hypothetical protein